MFCQTLPVILDLHTSLSRSKVDIIRRLLQDAYRVCSIYIPAQCFPRTRLTASSFALTHTLCFHLVGYSWDLTLPGIAVSKQDLIVKAVKRSQLLEWTTGNQLAYTLGMC